MSATREKEAADERRAVDLILASFTRDGIATMSEAEKVNYLSAGLLASYQLLRGLVGDKWVEGWLEAALTEVRTTPAWAHIRKPS